MSERKRIIYLAGPIQCARPEEASEWRETATGFLLPRGFAVINPLGKDDWRAADIVETDLADIARSDAVLAWLPWGLPSIGTAMEVFYAGRILCKPVVVWADSFEDHPWLKECANVICESLDEALMTFVRPGAFLFPAPPPAAT